MQRIMLAIYTFLYCDTYVMVSETEGVVYKRVFLRMDENGDPIFTLRSDNTNLFGDRHWTSPTTVFYE